jgi:hypothetical protein
MQKQLVCVDKKVLNLTHIFDFMEQTWPDDPPASRIFMPINRQALEKEIIDNPSNDVAVNNLNELNRAVSEGLWGGKAKVFEFGANALKGTRYAEKPSTTGAMLNFFIGVNAKVFIGTEVSSYSHDLLATRFYRDKMENYKYLPEGLIDWTPPGTEDSPGFRC